MPSARSGCGGILKYGSRQWNSSKTLQVSVVWRIKSNPCELPVPRPQNGH